MLAHKRAVIEKATNVELTVRESPVGDHQANGAAENSVKQVKGRVRTLLLAAVLPGVLFFTLIAKQQVYYTLPILGALSVLAASHRPLAWLGVIGGLWSFLALGIGVIPGGPWMPEAWVSHSK